ncbi:MAG: FmdB family zinc ribbon protein [Chloroflexota bacterium]|jgi:putative FmdB family regulatory protein
MPTYEYRCKGCGATVERWQRFNEAPLTECPSCGGILNRVVFPAGIIFKGSGWYCTDSRSKNSSESESSSTKSETASATA